MYGRGDYESNGYDVFSGQKHGNFEHGGSPSKQDIEVHVKALIPIEVIEALEKKGIDLVGALRDFSGCNVQMSKVPKFYPDTKEHICMAKGTISKTMRVMEAVLEMIQANATSSAHQDQYDLKRVERFNEMKVVVPNATAGVIIGKGGKNIEEVRNSTGANIRVYSKDGRDAPERVITIGANNSGVILDAIERMLERSLEEPLTPRRIQEVPIVEPKSFRDVPRYESRHKSRDKPNHAPRYEYRDGIEGLYQELSIIEQSHSPDVKYLVHSRRLLLEEVTKLKNNLNSDWIDLSRGKSYTKLVKCILLPQPRAGLNVVGRLLGIGGATLQQICQTYECQIGIAGAGSRRNAKEERDMLESGDPRYIHLNCPLHAEVSVSGEPHLVYNRLAKILLLVYKIITISESFEQDGIYVKASGTIYEKRGNEQSPRRRHQRTYDDNFVYGDRKPIFDGNRTSYF